MPQSPAVIERQLEIAKAERTAIEGTLSDMEPKKHPKWRAANGRCQQLERRLEAHQQQRGSGGGDDSAADE